VELSRDLEIVISESAVNSFFALSTDLFCGRPVGFR